MLHIGSGALRPGDALPSVRALARRLHIHRNTVTSAYRDPVLTKLVVRRPGNQLVVRDPQSRQAEVGNGLGEFVDSTIRAARQRGYSLKELSGRLRDRLLAAPPDHVLVLSDDVGMQVLISAELSARFSMPIHTCSAADLLADPDRLLGALLVSPPGDIPTLEAVIPAERPAISMIYSSAVDHASRIRRLDHPSLIVVASISEYFLEMARGVLAPAGPFHPELVDLWRPARRAWRRGPDFLRHSIRRLVDLWRPARRAWRRVHSGCTGVHGLGAT